MLPWALTQRAKALIFRTFIWALLLGPSAKASEGNEGSGKEGAA
jgi:hypothetical protein